MHSWYLLASAAVLQTVLAVQPVVPLNYTSYRGTALNNGITQWLGMRFAAPPVGDLRFAAPQCPDSEAGVQDADAFGPLCIGTNTGGPSKEISEDCLFINVYAPSSATKASKLPVYFFIQGGGFASNANPNYNGSGLITASDMNIVVVNINYRVGLYGFLAGQEVLADGSVNNGLKDQRAALQWVQQYISLFGGDPGHLTLGGDSAGAQSVNLQVTAYGGRDDGLFHATAAESQSFSALRTVEENQFAYDNLVIRTECASESDTLACLRGLSAADLQAQNVQTPFPGATYPPLYMYGPTLDYDFISDYTYNAYAQGKFVKVPAIGGDDSNEGSIFAPMTTANISDTDTFIKANFPLITLAQLKTFNDYYPIKGTPSFPDSGRAWREASKGYGELRYVCPGIFISGTMANMSVPNWNYRWNVIDPEEAAAGYGVPHTIETNAIWGPENVFPPGTAPTSYYANGTNAAIVPVVQGYWTSFIRSYNPNTYRAKGSPQWQPWTTGAGYWQRLRFQTNETAMETVPERQRERCTWLSSIGVSLAQ